MALKLIDLHTFINTQMSPYHIHDVAVVQFWCENLKWENIVMYLGSRSLMQRQVRERTFSGLWILNVSMKMFMKIRRVFTTKSNVSVYFATCIVLSDDWQFLELF